MTNTKKTLKGRMISGLLIAVLAVCMLLAVIPAFDGALVLPAYAEEVTYTVSSGTTVAQITSQLATYPAGTTVNMVLNSNVDFSNETKESNLTNHENQEYVAITVPAGLTVNLYMNGKTIRSSHKSNDDGASWQLKGIIAIENNGNLNIYSGSSASSPDKVGSQSSTSIIELYNERTDMSISDDEHSYSRLDTIVNNGNLTVNKNVELYIHNYLGYKDQSAERGSCTIAATGVYNSSTAATCVLNSAKLDILAQAYGITERTSSDVDHSRAFAYGVYGGQVTMTGDTDMHVNAYARMACSNIATSNKENGCLVTVAYGICSAGDITVTGGSITYGTDHACNQAVTAKGSSWSYEGGICYQSAPPVIADGTIKIADDTQYTNVRGNNKTFRECTVTKAPVMFYSGKALFCGDSTPGKTYGGVYLTYNEPSHPSTDVQAGQYKDEAGNTYNCAMNMTDLANVHAAKILRGAPEGQYRVHIVYRFWTSSAKTAVDTSVADGKGYTFNPTTDGSSIVSEKANFTGLVSNDTLMKTSGSGIKYSSGGAPVNSYYWRQLNIAYATPSAWFSDYKLTSTANRGEVFKSFVENTDNTVCAGTSAPVYIFVDYYKLNPTEISVDIDQTKLSSVTYTGNYLTPSDIGLRIVDTISGTDFTEEYNLTKNNPSLIDVSWSYTGTEKSGNAVTGSSLPKNAGTYQMTLNIADSTAYNTNSAKYKNRTAITDYTFTLEVGQASVNRGSGIPSTVNLTYGEQLQSKLDFADFNIVALGNDSTPAGMFTFNQANDGTEYKPAGSGDFYVRWTPSNTNGNYKSTTFKINYVCAKKQLTISPAAALVTYGESEFTTPFSCEITGLAGGDNTDAVRLEIGNAVSYMINANGGYVVYDPDEINAGSYVIRATVSNNPPAVLANYSYDLISTSADSEHNLTVAKRAIKVKATATGREYNADNYSANVTIEITEGKYGSDDIRFTAVTGTVSNNNAGSREVGGINKNAVAANMIGYDAGNYSVSEVTYATGSKLYVAISKATPSVSTPTVADVYYKRLQTLADVSLGEAAGSVAGTWQWVDPSVNPTVAADEYQAKFVPSDSTNYNEKVVSVTLNVVPTPVTVSYQGTVSYGDNIPNITAYTYTSTIDPDFDISYVSTTGNITPSTTYVKGSPVVDGGYPVTISAPNFADTAGNYSFTAQTGKITVNPKNIIFVIENAGITYGDNWNARQSAVISCDESQLFTGDTLASVTSDGSVPSFNKATTYNYRDPVGQYSITATPAFSCSPNYTVTVTPGTLTVAKAPLTIKAASKTLTYNSPVPSDLNSFTLEGAKNGETINAIVTEGAISVTTDYYQGAPVRDGGYTINVDVTGASFRNYDVTVDNGKITVTKADPIVEALPAASIVFGEALSDAVFTGDSVIDANTHAAIAGGWAYTQGTVVPAFSENPYQIYTASFVPEDTNNYNTKTGLIIALTVNKMTISGALSVDGIPMVGETLTVNTTGLNPSEQGVYTFRWMNGDSVIATGASYALTDSEKGIAITVVATAGGYYEGEAAYTTTVIAPELTSVTEIINADDWADYFTIDGLTSFGGTSTVTYDANPHSANFNQKSSTFSSAKIGSITVKYNGSTDIPTDAGFYTITIDVASPTYSGTITETAGKTVDSTGAVVYSPYANLLIGYLNITKADYSVVVTIADKVYDGTNSASAASVTESGAASLAGVADDVAYNKAAAIYTFANANVGENIAINCGNTSLKGEKAKNYNLVLTIANNGKANITARELKVAVVPESRAYEPDNTSVDLSFSVDASTIAPADNSSSVYVNEVGITGTLTDGCLAGERRVSVPDVVLSGSKAGNYYLTLTNLDNLTVEITKAIPTYPLPFTSSSLKYDAGRTLANISLGDSHWSWDSSCRNEVPQAGTHTYKAIFTPDDTENYATVEYSVPVVIRKAPVRVVAAGFNIKYGDGVPTYYYDVIGLTGSETVKADVGGYVLMNCSYEVGSPVNTYSIVLTGAFESNNYDFTYMNGSVIVEPRPVYTTAVARNREYEQDNLSVNVSFTALTNVLEADSANIYIAGSQTVTGTVTSDTAGQKTVTYAAPVLAGSKAQNYVLNINNPQLTVEILKARIPGVVLPTTGEVYFGQRLSSTVFTSSYEGTEYGTFAMKNAMSTPASTGTSSDYYVVFTPFNTTNYATIEQPITITVLQTGITVSVGVEGTFMVGKTVYARTSDIPAAAARYVYYTWYTADSPDATIGTTVASGEGIDSYTLTQSDAGKYLICSVTNTDRSPYAFSASANSGSTVSEESLTFWQKLVKWFYRLISNFTQLFARITG